MTAEITDQTIERKLAEWNNPYHIFICTLYNGENFGEGDVLGVYETRSEAENSIPKALKYRSLIQKTKYVGDQYPCEKQELYIMYCGDGPSFLYYERPKVAFQCQEQCQRECDRLNKLKKPDSFAYFFARKLVFGE